MIINKVVVTAPTYTLEAFCVCASTHTWKLVSLPLLHTYTHSAHIAHNSAYAHFCSTHACTHTHRAYIHMYICTCVGCACVYIYVFFGGRRLMAKESFFSVLSLFLSFLDPSSILACFWYGCSFCSQLGNPLISFCSISSLASHQKISHHHLCCWRSIAAWVVTVLLHAYK